MQLGDEENTHPKHEKHQIQEVQHSSNSNNETLTSPENSVSSPSSGEHLKFSKRFWEWSSFGKKTLLEFLQFVVIFVPLLTFVAGLMDSERVRQEQYRKDTNLKVEEYHQKVLSNYLDQMTKLLLEGRLREPTPEMRAFVSAKTLSTLRHLDDDGRRETFRFLQDANLLDGFISTRCKIDSSNLEVRDCQKSFINFEDAKLDGVVLRSKILPRVNLIRASLVGAKLISSDMREANMQEANLKDADLTDSLLNDAQMQYALLENAVLADTLLLQANLSNTNLINANLQGANLRDADLTGANLNNANLQGADLRGADLTGATLQGSDLKEAVYDNSTDFPEGFKPEEQGMLQQ